ncbi:MAG: response regulator, partial [Proteobacteria bacterium]|nr:response regulator [Pseudomonadota bacterium]
MPNSKILIVEDEGVIAKDIKNILSFLGYSVIAVASSGEEAIEKAKEMHPDLVLMDIVLEGDMDGVKAAEQIRDSFDIPVIYLTAYSDNTTLQRAKITEPYGYILKPFQERELYTTIEMALYKHQVEKKLKESEEKFRAIFEHATDGMLVVDLETKKFITGNAMLCEMLGYSPEEINNLKVKDIHPQENLPYVLDKIEEQARGEYTLATDIPVKRKDGSIFYADINASRISLYEKPCIMGS